MKIGMINIALELFNNGKFKNVKKILDLGTKELRASYDQLKFAFDQTKFKFNKKKFSKLKIFPKGKRVSASVFWKEFNIKEYRCSDINENKGKYYIDLNYPLKNKKLLNSFDLVADFGNNEHVFNVGEAYKSMYNLCKKDGFIWIFQSVYNGNGFFNFDISFFEGYAAANNLSVVYSCYLIHTSDYQQFVVPCDKELLNSFDLSKVKSINISYIFRKKTNNNFKYYYQYNYNNNQSPFKISFVKSEIPAEKIYIPTKSISELKKLAKKGNKASIDWLRAVGKKI